MRSIWRDGTNCPCSIEIEDIRGDLHDHTTWSDGTRSIEQMARAAAERGLTYLSISDHSRGRSVGNGLSVERLREQIAEVRSVATKYGIRLLCSSEVDIRADGSLDFPDDVLADLDIVVASIHSGFAGDRAKQTQRLLRAIENPYVNIIGHPTGALIEERAGYEFDAEAVFRAAAASGTAMEINANPARLDLSATAAARAKALGCTLSIDTDAHSFEDLDNLRFGVGTARRAGLRASDVLNARPLEGVLEFVAAKRATKSARLARVPDRTKPLEQFRRRFEVRIDVGSLEPAVPIAAARVEFAAAQREAAQLRAPIGLVAQIHRFQAIELLEPALRDAFVHEFGRVREEGEPARGAHDRGRLDGRRQRRVRLGRQRREERAERGVHALRIGVSIAALAQSLDEHGQPHGMIGEIALPSRCPPVARATPRPSAADSHPRRRARSGSRTRGLRRPRRR